MNALEQVSRVLSPKVRAAVPACQHEVPEEHFRIAYQPDILSDETRQRIEQWSGTSLLASIMSARGKKCRVQLVVAIWKWGARLEDLGLRHAAW